MRNLGKKEVSKVFITHVNSYNGQIIFKNIEYMLQDRTAFC